jgi:hypothetical protein
MSHSILGHGFYESINTTLSSEAVRASDGISAIYSLAVDFHTHCHTDSHSLLPNRLLGSDASALEFEREWPETLLI